MRKTPPESSPELAAKIEALNKTFERILKEKGQPLASEYAAKREVILRELKEHFDAVLEDPELQDIIEAGDYSTTLERMEGIAQQIGVLGVSTSFHYENEYDDFSWWTPSTRQC